VNTGGAVDVVDVVACTEVSQQCILSPPVVRPVVWSVLGCSEVVV
jgi:hypothetical protein